MPVISQDTRKEFVNVLEDQYKNTTFLHDDYVDVKPHINSLLSTKTYTVTTGHQLSVFASPLFFIYKILNFHIYFGN